MSRIIYGVMGDALGHVSRALTVAREMPHHEFLFLGGGKVQNLRTKGYGVEKIPMLSTHYANNRVDVAATISNAIREAARWRQTVRKVLRIVKEFQPDLVLTDYELFAPIAARRLGIPCVSIDHQHFLTECCVRPLKGQTLSRFMFSLPLRAMYSKSDYYLITSFFPVVPKTPGRTEIFPPILGRDITDMVPAEGDHVLVYQTSATFSRLFSVLTQMPHRCFVYGVEGGPSAKNIVYKGFSRRSFLKDLAACRYVIANGGHNVISESLYFGKPVFSFPIHLAYEQCVNAHMLDLLGYGAYSDALRPDLSCFETFEKRLDGFRERICRSDFSGAEKLTRRLEGIIRAQCR